MWDVVILEDGEERRLDGDFHTQKDALIVEESVCFDYYKAVPSNA